jgi:hypothetical protein
LLIKAAGSANNFDKPHWIKYRDNKAVASYRSCCFFITGQRCPATLQSSLAFTSDNLYRPTIMHLATLPLRLFFTVLLVSFSTSIIALDIDQLGKTETMEKWGQVLFCQRIYKMPEVKPRLYDFDIEHCEKAGQLITDVVSKYSKQEQEQLKYRAERHAIALSYNTSEPYHSVAACRAYCRELAEIQDKHNDR